MKFNAECVVSFKVTTLSVHCFYRNLLNEMKCYRYLDSDAIIPCLFNVQISPQSSMSFSFMIHQVESGIMNVIEFGIVFKVELVKPT